MEASVVLLVRRIQVTSFRERCLCCEVWGNFLDHYFVYAWEFQCVRWDCLLATCRDTPQLERIPQLLFKSITSSLDFGYLSTHLCLHRVSLSPQAHEGSYMSLFFSLSLSVFTSHPFQKTYLFVTLWTFGGDSVTSRYPLLWHSFFFKKMITRTLPIQNFARTMAVPPTNDGRGPTPWPSAQCRR